MGMSFQDWAKDVSGKVIGSGQCVGLAQDYETRVLDGGFLATAGGPHPGYASDSFEGYSTNGLSSTFTKVPAGVKAQPGSLAFWAFGTQSPGFSAPLSHVAVVLADNGSTLKVMDQNSMGSSVAAVHTLPKIGLLGYLVPNGGVGGPPPDGAGTNAVPAGDLPSTGNWITDSVMGAVISSMGLTNVVKSGSPFTEGVANFLTGFFLPATWVRVLAAFIGIGLLIAGFHFIITDYKKSGGE